MLLSIPIQVQLPPVMYRGTESGYHHFVLMREWSETVRTGDHLEMIPHQEPRKRFKVKDDEIRIDDSVSPMNNQIEWSHVQNIEPEAPYRVVLIPNMYAPHSED